MMAVSLVSFPKASYDASVRGLETWWNIVFPSLLPFFIVSELLIGFGVVKLLGVMFEPLMRPLFRVPGTGGVVWAIGMASGYPAGAKLTARLRQEKQLTRIEAERLASFTNYSNPLFMFSAVAIGFYDNAKLGLLIALCHYLGNFCVGLVMRFYGHEKKRESKRKKREISLRTAFNVLHRQRIEDNRPFGKLLGDAVSSSISTLLMIGGFIILFSVVNKLLSVMNISGVSITEVLSSIFAFILAQLHIPPELSHALVPGLFEITLGSQFASQIDVSLLFKIIVTGFILAFSGFSVQAQVASIFADTDIRFKPFFFARCMHGVFAACLTMLLWKPLYLDRVSSSAQDTVHVFDPGSPSLWWESMWQLLLHYGSLVTLFALVVYIAILLKSLLNKSPIS